ncbi:hypothetical protein [Nitrobacter sp. TKz-YC02]|uniref:hypothetical protein n=1 Tax=Nitrobacter sp. TKz-YC02 TaxID=3398704 RepID=UPI003CE9281B
MAKSQPGLSGDAFAKIANLVFVCETKGLHPSHLLRPPDQDARALECERFVGDLKIAATQLRRDKAA